MWHCTERMWNVSFNSMINFLNIIHRPNVYFKHHFGKRTFSPSSAKDSTILVTNDKAGPYLRTPQVTQDMIRTPSETEPTWGSSDWATYMGHCTCNRAKSVKPGPTFKLKVKSMTQVQKSTTKYVINSGALVRQRTIPTERPPLVGEVGANFRG
jgi:hypothetical protein